MLSVKGGLKLGFAAPRLLRTSRLLNCCSAHQNRPNSRVAVKGLSGADAPEGNGEDSSTPSSAHFNSSTSNAPDEGKPDEDTQDDGTPGEGTDPREDFIRFLWPKIRTLDFGLAKEVYDNYAARIPYSSGLDALEQISAADWLLQWGEGCHQVSEGLPRPLRFWSAWRIYAAYNAKKGVTQSKKKQQALFTIHMVSLLRFPGAYFKAEYRGEGDVMKELQFTLSRDPWALMMKQSTFTFREMEAVADKFGADLSSPSRGVAALLSKLKEKCNNFKVTHMTWPKLEEETSALLGAKFKTPLKHCMAKLLDVRLALAYHAPIAGIWVLVYCFGEVTLAHALHTF
ncbi:hypothetical protein DUNSADRAFT_13041 [Dunaliella salina]|uniref:Uncharacterized protein n=1 Tax=Dunaliella salina TaxID=3046 RepID=A0ABQ7GA49_DUNSA|nr:hypothetical protein DUNSADRAFT_13041 [Dunaliella salina]|eukprot:KAF5831483.1 hypothetical protein DUNSADRAFT_13041 [Dunaliella salina]